MRIYKTLYATLSLTGLAMLLDIFWVLDTFIGIPAFFNYWVVYVLIGIAGAKFLCYGYLLFSKGKMMETISLLYFAVLLELISFFLVCYNGIPNGESTLIFLFSSLALISKITELNDLKKIIAYDKRNNGALSCKLNQ
jgi:hypothetical protein